VVSISLDAILMKLIEVRGWVILLHNGLKPWNLSKQEAA
jgi:hypothetical protein